MRSSCCNKKIQKQSTPVSPETTSDPPSKPRTARPAASKKKTRGKAARAVAQDPDTKPSPVPPVSHTPRPQRAATNGHLPQYTATPSPKNALKERKKKTVRCDVTPDEGSDRFPDLTQTEQHKAKITPSHTQGSKRAAKETLTHSTLLHPCSLQDTPVSPGVSDSGVKVPGRGCWPNHRLSSTPRCSRTLLSEPQVSHVRVSAHLSSITRPVILISINSFFL